MLRDTTLIKITAILSVTALGIVYFITVRQDGTVLLSLCSIIGGLAGYWLGRKRK